MLSKQTLVSFEFNLHVDMSYKGEIGILYSKPILDEQSYFFLFFLFLISLIMLRPSETL